MMNKKEVAELKSELLLGNTSQLENLYKLYRKDILSFLSVRKLCREEEGHDYFSQAIIIFYESVMDSKITELKSVKNYLIGICINLTRLNNTYQCKVDKKMDEVRKIFYENNDEGVDDEVYKNKLISISQKALNLLNDKCQKIIVGYYIHRWSMKEIANRLSLSSGDVAKTLKSRCYKSLLNNVQELQNKYSI